MTKAAALYQFFNEAIPDVPAYPETSVPSKANGDPADATFPYLTYSPAYSALNEGEVSITVNLWYHTSSEAAPNAAAEILSEKIGRGGITIPFDGGYIWLKRGSPFSQAVRDTDPDIKRRYINITAEYLSNN